ncbi:MAG: alpha/beta fold hydrolase [Acidimicrobiales bacterium]|nr:alpha/beta fold hydrolase [Acidimicrobiales bacterium]
MSGPTPSPRSPRPAPTALVLLVGLIALVAVACGSGVQETGAPDVDEDVFTPADPTTVPAPETDIDFGPCDLGFGECGTVTVPLDHSDPDGDTIDVEVARVPAANPDERIGVLLTNPGGPGASGIEFALAQPFPQEVLDRFDIIGWDPRGVGGTEGLTCGENVDAFLDIDPEPDSNREQRQLDEAARAVADECEQTDGELLPFVGTRDVVQDMDAIREALGEEQISYAGYSYGTALGLGYLEEFPDRVRAMVLDGVVDPTQDLTGFLLAQGQAIEEQVNALLDGCADDPSCPLDDAGAAFDRVAAQLDEEPLPGGDGEVGPSELQTGAVYATYGFEGNDAELLWQALADAEDGDGDAIAALAQQYYDLSSYTPYAAVECVDSEVPQGSEEFQAFADELIAVAPRTGASVANELLPCAFWPAPPSGDPHVVTAPGSPAVLVIGTTGDAATPYQQSVDVAENLEDGHLLTLDATGHVASGRSTCIDDASATYLIDLVLPPEDTVCEE